MIVINLVRYQSSWAEDRQSSGRPAPHPLGRSIKLNLEIVELECNHCFLLEYEQFGVILNAYIGRRQTSQELELRDIHLSRFETYLLWKNGMSFKQPGETLKAKIRPRLCLAAAEIFWSTLLLDSRRRHKPSALCSCNYVNHALLTEASRCSGSPLV